MRGITRHRLWIALLALVLAFGFLGTRGIWDPDEGRYTNVAVNMLDSGDWLNPRRNEDVGHWTKPPLTYWAIASSVGVFGKNAWAARLPAALSYLLCIWLAWRIARRLAPGAEDSAAIVYATMLFTLGASQFISTDFVLAACETLAVWGFVEARFAHRLHCWRWIALMWVGFALAFLTKGPPALLPLLVIIAFDRLMPARNRHRLFVVSGVLLFALLALPWFIAVIHNTPGLFEYFIGDEVVNRVTTNEFGRHGEWYGWLKIYAPTLLFGTAPWTLDLLRWARTLPATIARWWRDRAARGHDASAVLLALWVLVPLLVFCLSRSRLPLYVLPLFVPLAVLVARQRQLDGRGLPRWPMLALWAACLLGLKFAAAHWPTHKDASKWADEIRQRMGGPVHEIVFVEDMARYGLRLHLDAEIEKISFEQLQDARFNPQYDETLAMELADAVHEPGAIWICKQAAWPALQARIAASGYRVQALGAPYQGRIVFRVLPAAAG
ncbi:MAG: glycosyltransferase family 39 protein [Luteimonas sp.]